MGNAVQSRIMHLPLRTLGLLACLGSAAGCVTVSVSKQDYANITAGEVGCPADELKISGEKGSFGIGDQMTPWVAECRGHRFICSAVGSVASCKEELKAAEATAPVPAPQATDNTL